MKKFLFIALLSLLAACSSDDGDSVSTEYPPGTEFSLVRMDLGYVNESTPYTILEYTYNESRRLDFATSTSSDGTGGTFTSDYQYQNGRVVNIAYSNGGNRTYSYSGEQLVSSTFGASQYDYTYDTFGRLESITVSTNSLSCTTTYTYSNGSQPTESFNDCTGNTTVYTYDNKINPQYYQFNASFSKAAPLTPNNISSLTVSGPVPEASYTTDIIYNADGLPTEIRYLDNGTYVSSSRFYYVEN